MFSIQLCVDGKGSVREIEPDQVREMLHDPRAIIWLNVDRSSERLAEVGERFGFHNLAIEDAVDENERPKTTIYTNHVFILLSTLHWRHSHLVAEPISMFVGQNYVVTVADEASPVFDEVRRRWREFHDSIPHRGAGTLAYSLIDTIVDKYFPVIDRIGERLEALETGLLERNVHNPRRIVHDTRMELLKLRRIISPEREAINILTRRDVPVFDDRIAAYMDDVYDHILRALDWIDMYRDVLSNLSDLQFSVESSRLNQTMRMLTAWSIIFMALTLIAGIYGMNFDNMPELHWHYGYPLSLLAMLVLGGIIFAFFRRRRWL